MSRVISTQRALARGALSPIVTLGSAATEVPCFMTMGRCYNLAAATRQPMLPR